MPDEVEDLGSEWNLAALLDEGCMPLGFVAAIKYLDADGEVNMITASSTEITLWERLGMVQASAEEVKMKLRGAMEVDE